MAENTPLLELDIDRVAKLIPLPGLLSALRRLPDYGVESMYGTQIDFANRIDKLLTGERVPRSRPKEGHKIEKSAKLGNITINASLDNNSGPDSSSPPYFYQNRVLKVGGLNRQGLAALYESRTVYEEITDPVVPIHCVSSDISARFEEQARPSREMRTLALLPKNRTPKRASVDWEEFDFGIEGHRKMDINGRWVFGFAIAVAECLDPQMFEPVGS
jgi:hypothetical protein